MCLGSQTGSWTLLSLTPSFLSSGLARWPCPNIVYPSRFHWCRPTSVGDPSRSASFCQDRRADPISWLSSSQSSHASLSGEADNVANILRHAARLASLGAASFPTVNGSAATFPDSQLAITSLLTQLIAMVNNIGAFRTFLTSQVVNVASAQAGRSATPSPPATSNLEASLKDLSSRVAALSSHHTRQVAPPPSQAPPVPPPLLSNLNQLSRRRNSPPASRLELSLP